MTRRFLGALQFLTVVPVRVETASLSESAVFFPWIGALLGASAGGIMLLAERVFSPSLAALLAIAWLIVVTGSLHEDALADVADAFRAGRSREKILLILRDSRIGAYGGVALALSVVIRWQALADWRINPVYGLAAALAVSRASLVVMGGTTASAGEDLGRKFAAGLSARVVLLAGLQGAAFSLLAGWRSGLLLCAAAGVIVGLARWWFVRQLGGVNGDCLGATGQAVEMIELLVLAARTFL